MSDFEETVCIQKDTFWFFYSVKTTKIAFLMLFQKAWIWMEILITCQISNWKKYNASDFELTFLQGVRFWAYFFLQFANLSCVYQNRARFGNVLMYGVGSVSQVILSGYALCTPSVINVTRHIKTANPIRVCSTIYLDEECYLTMFY